MGKNSGYNKKLSYKSHYYLMDNIYEKFDENDWNNNNTIMLDDSISYDNDEFNNQKNFSSKKIIEKYKKY